MKAWLHFGSGDYLLFQSWIPSSNGAIAGASIAIFIFSILERWLAALRRTQEHRWRTKALALVLSHQSANTMSSPSTQIEGGGKRQEHGDGIQEIRSLPHGPRHASRSTLRLIPPFIPSHDITRGMVHVIQSAFTYALMLIVMTFNAAYIISVILGLGLGEILFGRMGHIRDGSTMR
ncbi:hypothetical protein ID866_10855 [Astraeus odoratus]|nr:hypothetical protein ID866_10855 [Astraeus odoratus]